ncbi:hypothetical protein MKK75_00540, partial [Methylobacterium sp. J-030]|uniref:hypothetical protein n=1 Tax=Methylobacterium sp. J-030 TaxID=2836627 RepID=UPI001FB98722
PRNERPQRFTIGVCEFLKALKLADQCILHWATTAKGNLPSYDLSGAQYFGIGRISASSSL